MGDAMYVASGQKPARKQRGKMTQAVVDYDASGLGPLSITNVSMLTLVMSVR